MILTIALFFIAIIYASVGHGGASGYLAAMALSHVPVEMMRVSALVLNCLVALIGSYQFSRQKVLSWPLLWPLILTSIPMAAIGGQINLPSLWLKTVLGLVLLYSAAYSLWSMREHKDVALSPPSNAVLMTSGAIIGLFSGLTGVGGGIFLSPLLLMMKCAPIKTISGTSAVFILVNSLSGLGGKFVGDGYRLDLHPDLIWWAVAAVFGGLIGSELGAKRFNATLIKVFLSLVLLIAGLKMVGLRF